MPTTKHAKPRVTFAVESATTELSSEVASSTTIRLGERFLLGSKIAVEEPFLLGAVCTTPLRYNRSGELQRNGGKGGGGREKRVII